MSKTEDAALFPKQTITEGVYVFSLVIVLEVWALKRGFINMKQWFTKRK